MARQPGEGGHSGAPHTVIPGRERREAGANPESRHDGDSAGAARDSGFACGWRRLRPGMTVLDHSHVSAIPRRRGARVVGISSPLFPKRGRAERRTPGASAASCAKCRKHTSLVTTKAPNRPAFRTRWSVGLLRALPGNGRNLLAVVSAGSRRRPDLDASAADLISVGTTRFGPPRKAIRMGRISTPVRTAQRRRPPRCPSSRGCGRQSGPCGRRSSAGPRPGQSTAARRCRVHRIPPREP